jgi:hypothetical protein
MKCPERRRRCSPAPAATRAFKVDDIQGKLKAIMTIRPAFRDAALQHELQTSGFARVPFLNTSEVKSLLEKLVSDVGPAWARCPEICGRQRTFHSTNLDDDLDYRRRVFDLVQETIRSPLNRLLNDYKVVTAGLVVKASNSGKLTLHADPTLTRQVEDTSLTIWCPLVDTNADNGGLFVVPGSHRIAPQINGPGIAGSHWPYVEALAPYAVPLDLAAGEAIIFNSQLLHGSPPNKSEHIRPAMMVACIPEEAEAVLYTPGESGSSTLHIFNHSEARYLKYPGEVFFSGGATEEMIGSMPNPNQHIDRHEFELRLAGLGSSRGGRGHGWRARFGQLKRSLFSATR